MAADSGKYCSDIESRMASSSPRDVQETHAPSGVSPNSPKDSSFSYSCLQMTRLKSIDPAWQLIPPWSQRWLNNLNEATQASIIRLPPVFLISRSADADSLGSVCRRPAFAQGFESQGAGGVQSGGLSYNPQHKSCCLPTIERYWSLPEKYNPPEPCAFVDMCRCGVETDYASSTACSQCPHAAWKVSCKEPVKFVPSAFSPSVAGRHCGRFVLIVQ